MDCLWGICSARPGQMAARYVYGVIFLLTNLIAWVIRDYSDDHFSDLPYFKGCSGVHSCLASEGVLRLSFGCFMFFLLMFLTTVGTSKNDDPRDAWHCAWWPLKLTLWLAFIVSPFFIPTKVIKIYGEVARFGAGIFLGVQLLTIINFIYWWNDRWLAPEKERRCFIPMVTVTLLSFIASLSGLVYMFLWFAPSASCSLNIFFITFTIILMVTMAGISVHPKVNAGLMTSSIMSLYIVFLCWSAIMSEPRSETCNTTPRQTGKSDLLTVLSFFLGIMAIVFATFSTGADSNPFEASSSIPKFPEAEKLVPYGYGFFHFVFAAGSMYFAMLFVGWNLHQTMYKWSIDVGWASVWVKITNQWLAASLYIWTMVSEFLPKNKN